MRFMMISWALASDRPSMSDVSRCNQAVGQWSQALARARFCVSVEVWTAYFTNRTQRSKLAGLLPPKAQNQCYFVVVTNSFWAEVAQWITKISTISRYLFQYGRDFVGHAAALTLEDVTDVVVVAGVTANKAEVVGLPLALRTKQDVAERLVEQHRFTVGAYQLDIASTDLQQHGPIIGAAIVRATSTACLRRKRREGADTFRSAAAASHWTCPIPHCANTVRPTYRLLMWFIKKNPIFCWPFANFTGSFIGLIALKWQFQRIKWTHVNQC